MGVLATDEMHLVAANGDRAKLNFVFGYELLYIDFSEIFYTSIDGLIYLSSKYCTGVLMINKANF